MSVEIDSWAGEMDTAAEAGRGRGVDIVAGRPQQRDDRAYARIGVWQRHVRRNSELRVRALAIVIFITSSVLIWLRSRVG